MVEECSHPHLHIVLPCILWLVIRRPPKLGFMWFQCLVVAIITGIIAVLGCVGALYNIAEDSKTSDLWRIGRMYMIN